MKRFLKAVSYAFLSVLLGSALATGLFFLLTRLGSQDFHFKGVFQFFAIGMTLALTLGGGQGVIVWTIFCYQRFRIKRFKPCFYPLLSALAAVMTVLPVTTLLLKVDTGITIFFCFCQCVLFGSCVGLAAYMLERRALSRKGS